MFTGVPVAALYDAVLLGIGRMLQLYALLVKLGADDQK